MGIPRVSQIPLTLFSIKRRCQNEITQSLGVGCHLYVDSIQFCKSSNKLPDADIPVLGAVPHWHGQMADKLTES